jgi:hypothetical protein
MRNGRDVSVLIVLERFEHPPIPRCDTTLTIDGRRQPPPTVNLQAHDRVVVAWYGRAAGEAQLDVACSSGQTLTRNLHLAAGSVTTVRHYLVKR